jgi:hypothetical protein
MNGDLACPSCGETYSAFYWDTARTDETDEIPDRFYHKVCRTGLGLYVHE